MYEKKELKSQNIKSLVYFLKIKYEQVFDKKDIYYLKYFLSGFIMARIQLQKSDKIDEYFLENFSIWLSKKFETEINHTTSWVDIIDTLFPDEEKIDKFFDFFDDFISEFEGNECNVRNGSE